MGVRRTWTCIALVVAFALGGCVDNSDLRWTEDVKLPDGRVVTLKRWVEFKGGASRFGAPSTESRQSFEFKHPTTGETVQWRNDMTNGRLHTIGLWLDGTTPMLLGSPAYGGDLRKYLCPNPPYLLFEYRAAAWQQIPLQRISLTRLRSNMTSHVLEKRAQIRSNGLHLDAHQTSNSYTYLHGKTEIPYILKFEGIAPQTFDHVDCSRISNLRELLEGEKP